MQSTYFDRVYFRSKQYLAETMSSLLKAAKQHKIKLDPSNAHTIEQASRKYFCNAINHERKSKRLIFWGTCQTASIVYILNHTTLSSEYDIVLLGQNFRIANYTGDELTIELEKLNENLRKDDLLIYTPVEANPRLTSNSLRSFFRPQNHLYIPYIVNTGAFPFYQSRRGWNISQNMLNNQSILEILNGTYKFELYNRFNSSLAELERRESKNSNGMNLGISDFIRKESKNKRLFFTYNHPLWPVMRHLAIGIGKYLKMNLCNELPIENKAYDNLYFNRTKVHLNALVNSTVTPYVASELGWDWAVDNVDPYWRIKYKKLLKICISSSQSIL